MNMKALVRGKRVAVVGRAGSIIGRGNGEAIDRADVVIRVNWLLPVLEDQVVDAGRRTDLVYTCINCGEARRLAEEHGVPWARVNSKRRRKVTGKFFASPAGLRCTTGFLAVVEAATGGAKSVSVYGFDLFRSGHCQERWPDKSEEWKQERVGKSGIPSEEPLSKNGWRHDEVAEAKAWRVLLKRYGRIKPDAVLWEALR